MKYTYQVDVHKKEAEKKHFFMQMISFIILNDSDLSEERDASGRK
jgi:hypothetical protein